MGLLFIPNAGQGVITGRHIQTSHWAVDNTMPTRRVLPLKGPRFDAHGRSLIVRLLRTRL